MIPGNESAQRNAELRRVVAILRGKVMEAQLALLAAIDAADEAEQAEAERGAEGHVTRSVPLNELGNE
jgi:hypothetical protein